MKSYIYTYITFVQNGMSSAFFILIKFCHLHKVPKWFKSSDMGFFSSNIPVRRHFAYNFVKVANLNCNIFDSWLAIVIACLDAE